MKGRHLLIYLAIKHQGNWDEIYAAIKSREQNDPKVVEETLSKLTCKTTTLIDEDYPIHNKSMYHPPFVLFYYGDLSLCNEYKKILAVIGSRDYSEYGKNITKKIVSEVANQMVIISGLARGIDSVAHRACIDCGGKTIAVLGCGIDRCYPANNKDLYSEIKEHHLLISEYPGDMEATKDNFPQRNRIIAALSCGVLVTEAHAKSGTLITVGYALDFGREVLCVPHPADEGSQCNRLISGGAVLVENGEDVLYALL